MQQHDSDYFFVVAVMFKCDKLRRHPRPNIGASMKSRGSLLSFTSYLEFSRTRSENLAVKK